MAVLMTFLFKKDPDVSEYEQRLGKMTEGTNPESETGEMTINKYIHFLTAAPHISI